MKDQNDELQGLLSLNTLLPVFPIVAREYNLAEREEVPTPPILDREQIMYAEDRFMMLVRHHTSHHWCGYVRVTPEEWARVEKDVRAVSNARINFVGFPTQYIVWMARNSQGLLKQPTGTMLPDEDHWVGFDTMRSLGEELVTIESAREALYGLENLIYRLKRGEIKIGNHSSL